MSSLTNELANWVLRINALCAEKDAEIKQLTAALLQSANWFQEYADGHTAKGDTEKAARNQDRANACRRALEGMK
jgi:hypothetical protein